MPKWSLHYAVTTFLFTVFGFGMVTANNAQAVSNNADTAAATPAFSEAFDDVTTLPGKGWFMQNNSTPNGTTGWFQGNTETFPAQAGAATAYISANFNSSTGSNTISNWLLTPTIEFKNGDVITFYTRTTSTALFPDRLQVRLSTNGASTNVGTGPTGIGDFTRLLLDINPTYISGTAGGYPVAWTQFTITISGLTAPANGRLAFRYFVEDGGPDGENSNYIGIDTFAYTPAGGSVGDAPVDFNGDGKTDYAVIRNVGGTGGAPANQLRWFYNTNGTGAPTVAFDWGLTTDFIVPEDYDGDGKDDIAVWRPGAPNVAAFYILNSATNTARVEAFGQTDDDPTIVGDYNGDGKADLAVYRQGASAGAQSTWFYRSTPGGPTIYVPWGVRGDVPAPGDYDGDAKNDFVVYRFNGDTEHALFWTKLATGTVLPVQPLGRFATDYVAPGDYDGDGKTDYALVRRSTGPVNWFWKRSSDGALIGPVTFGESSTDLPVQGDYDGDGKTDIAVWRNNGLFISRSTGTGAITYFGLGSSTDYPVANYNTH
ncbi:MAG: domain, repeat-containing protein [Acidobacteria bacterium]|nr:domain, repeat-containing protein [Acidobacteriota bacterium]